MAILHYLCHIAKHNHSGRFERLLTSLAPNQQKVKAQLN
ncbi:YgjP-like metallopeptidase domain-containing protein [Vibrio lentus]